MTDRHRPVLQYRTLLGPGLTLMAVAIGVVWATSHSLVDDRELASSWQRALETDGSAVQAFDRTDASQASLHPASTAETVRPLIVGDRVTIVTPDGSILSFRVCDPASPASTSAPDCLNAAVSRAVAPPPMSVPQRSL